MPKKPRPKRLHTSLTAHYHAMRAAFSASAAHKLPGSKGIIREDAIAKFVSIWVSKRFTTLTNAFAVAPNGEEAPVELDLVVHDSAEGSVWPLDSESMNSVVTCEHIKMIVEIKSTLTKNELCKAVKSMKKFGEFITRHEHLKMPLRVLFAYKVDPDLIQTMQEEFAVHDRDHYPFDAFIFLEEAAYFADFPDLRSLRLGIPKGLGPYEVENDGPSTDRIILEEHVLTNYSNGYRWVPDGTPELNLLSLATLATYATQGPEATSALLAAAIHRDMNPISP